MEQMMAILRMSKVVTPGRMTYSLRYALPFPSSTEPEAREMILPRYREALARFSGALLDIEKTVPCPVPDADLVGLEPLLEEIRTAIILPLELAVSGIPIKKGALLCGPPGTGKSSIGRWLAHQIKGRFYLIGGTLSGSQLVDNFEQTVIRAQSQAPAVIFIDDCDLLFEHDEVFRSFLTILDGIETGKRADLCVILTCMDLRRIPAALLRGGRLEMVLVTRLPDRDQITAILEQALTKMIAAVQQQFPSLSEVLEQERRVVSSVALRMSGWNCADVHRAVTDVGRALLAGKRPPLLPLFEKVIREIKQQYQLCGATASTNLDHRPQEAYIS
jgi:SpoVK/Ycf46/Vps4 family AAA+-type ATPase